MVGRVLIYLMKSGIWNFVLNFHEMLGNPVHFFCSILVGKSCGLLTWYRNRRNRLSRSRNKVSPLPHSALTSCIFLIARGYVLKGLLWGDKPPAVVKRSSPPEGAKGNRRFHTASGLGDYAAREEGQLSPQWFLFPILRKSHCRNIHTWMVGEQFFYVLFHVVGGRDYVNEPLENADVIKDSACRYIF